MVDKVKRYCYNPLIMAEQDTQDPENLKEGHATKVIVEMPEDTVKKLLELQKEAKEKVKI